MAEAAGTDPSVVPAASGRLVAPASFDRLTVSPTRWFAHQQGVVAASFPHCAVGAFSRGKRSVLHSVAVVPPFLPRERWCGTERDVVRHRFPHPLRRSRTNGSEMPDQCSTVLPDSGSRSYRRDLDALGITPMHSPAATTPTAPKPPSTSTVVSGWVPPHRARSAVRVMTDTVRPSIADRKGQFVQHPPGRPRTSRVGSSAGDEVLGLRVVADDRRGGLLGLVLEAGLLADLDAEPVGAEQLGDAEVVLQVRARGVAP